MRFLYLLFIFLFLGACNNFSPNKAYETPDYEKIADVITARTAQKIESETGLVLSGVGGGMMDQVRMMAMSFDCFGEISMEQGRELVIYCVNEYLSAINANIEIRPYLIHYPFSSKDVQIRIFINSKNGKEVGSGNLSIVTEINGKVSYKIRDPESQRLRIIHEEAYEEAVKILEAGEPVNKVRKNLSHV
jgi:hypothetical protein